MVLASHHIHPWVVIDLLVWVHFGEEISSNAEIVPGDVPVLAQLLICLAVPDRPIVVLFVLSQFQPAHLFGYLLDDVVLCAGHIDYQLQLSRGHAVVGVFGVRVIWHLLPVVFFVVVVTTLRILFLRERVLPGGDFAVVRDGSSIYADVELGGRRTELRPLRRPGLSDDRLSFVRARRALRRLIEPLSLLFEILGLLLHYLFLCR